ncbi:hypothetical protein GCM10010136_27130 [Limoniibacter endophyticus]|uniref:Uncharacterized protein n=1 Tax=Limoniibacter endophyticus TaxID=1565040 RepID=A0A8J3DTZ7_9HYPH|nr:hypothetical protein GCM10010136_27130 [Limoniibacter endophyticus]
MAMLVGYGFDEHVAVIIAEGGQVDHGERIGGGNGKSLTRLHRSKTLSSLQNGERAIQPSEIVNFGEGRAI